MSPFKHCLKKITTVAFVPIILLAIYPANGYSQNYKHWMSLCDKYYYTPNFKEAVYYARLAQQAALNEVGEKTSTYAYIAGSYMGLCYMMNRQPDSAAIWYNKSMETYEQLNDTSSKEYAETLGNYGNLCNEQAKYFDSEPAFIKALRILKNYPMAFDDIGATQNGLATVYLYKGDYSGALGIYLKLEQLFTMAPPMEQTGILLNNIASCYLSIGNIAKALQYQRKAVKMFDAIKNATPEKKISARLTLAQIYYTAGFLDSAYSLYSQLLQLIEVKSGNEQYAFILNGLATINIEQRNYEKAEQQLREALSLTEHPSHHSQIYFGIVNSLASVLLRRKEYKDAEIYFKNGIADAYLQGLGNSTIIRELYKGLCETLLLTNKTSEAGDSLLSLSKIFYTDIRSNFPGLSESEQLLYRKGLDIFFDLLYTYFYTTNQHTGRLVNFAYRLEQRRKNIALSNKTQLSNQIRKLTDSTSIALAAQWQKDNELLYAQYQLAANKRSINIDSLSDACDFKERVLSAKFGFASYNINTAPTPVKNNYTSLEFIHFGLISPADFGVDIMYGAFVQKENDTTVTFTLLSPSHKIISLLQDNNGKWIKEEIIASKIYEPGNEKASRLYSYLWQPIEKILGKHTSKIVIKYRPAGIITKINLSALYSGSAFLGSKYLFHRVAAFTEPRADSLSKNKNIYIWSNMNYDTAVYNHKDSIYLLHRHKQTNQFSFPVNDSLFEPLNDDVTNPLLALFTKSGYTAKAYEKCNATEDSFKTESASTTGILHINTHGEYLAFNSTKQNGLLPRQFLAANAHSMYRNFLVFAGANKYWATGLPPKNHNDGILTASEVSMLNLSGVQLVTLAACESGLGEVTGEEGIIGLQRAFKIAGVQTILASLWRVPEQQTKELLLSFYSYVLAGKTFYEALSNAQTDMQKRHKGAYNWAGFVLIE